MRRVRFPIYRRANILLPWTLLAITCGLGDTTNKSIYPMHGFWLQALDLDGDYLTHLNYAVTLLHNDEPERAAEQFASFKQLFEVCHVSRSLHFLCLGVPVPTRTSTSYRAE